LLNIADDLLQSFTAPVLLDSDRAEMEDKRKDEKNDLSFTEH
jgi:hypothetical protein